MWDLCGTIIEHS
jgi:hypothetical protein